MVTVSDALGGAVVVVVGGGGVVVVVGGGGVVVVVVGAVVVVVGGDVVVVVDGGGGVPTGSSVKVAVNVTPPPDTEMSTSVRVDTAWLEMWKPPAAANRGTMTVPCTPTRSGRELVSENVTSSERGSSAVTRPNDPDVLEVVVGSRVSDVGRGCGVKVVVAWVDTPRHVAVIVTGVSVATMLVGIEKASDATPAGTVTVAGGRTAGFELDRLTTAPPGGACPFNITMPPLTTPPLWRSGTPSKLAKVGGSTVKVWLVACDPMVAVIVADVGAATCPVTNRNATNDTPAGTGTDGGSGAACGFELVRLTVAPPAGAPLLSCR